MRRREAAGVGADPRARDAGSRRYIRCGLLLSHTPIEAEARPRDTRISERTNETPRAMKNDSMTNPNLGPKWPRVWRILSLWFRALRSSRHGARRDDATRRRDRDRPDRVRDQANAHLRRTHLPGARSRARGGLLLFSPGALGGRSGDRASSAARLRGAAPRAPPRVAGPGCVGVSPAQGRVLHIAALEAPLCPRARLHGVGRAWDAAMAAAR